MLGLFKEEEISLAPVEALARTRELLSSSLNKGLIPLWDELASGLPLMDGGTLRMVEDWFRLLTEWPFLKEALEQPGNEFFFHSPGSCQRVLPDGSKLSFQIPLDPPDWQLWLEVVSTRYRQNWNVQVPFTSFHGKFNGRGYRFGLIHGSTSPLGRSKLVLRSLPSTPHPLSSFGDTSFLEAAVREKRNLLIAGSTGSGKTSLLSSLLTVIPRDEHLVVLEDAYEIPPGLAQETRFLAGSGPETSLKAFLTYSLRLSPDRIILGEMRSHEVVPFLLAMNTGHRGLMGTIHAASAQDALSRVALLFGLYAGEAGMDYARVMELLCRNLDYVVFMDRKRVTEVIKVLGADKGVAFYESLGGPGGGPVNLDFL